LTGRLAPDFKTLANFRRDNGAGICAVCSQSGNPRGRPKGARNKMLALNEERLKDFIMIGAYRTIKVNDGPRQAIVRSVAGNAVKGQHRS
jgi:Family of unknown function (DUF5681)